MNLKCHRMICLLSSQYGTLLICVVYLGVIKLSSIVKFFSSNFPQESTSNCYSTWIKDTSIVHEIRRSKSQPSDLKETDLICLLIFNRVLTVGEDPWTKQCRTQRLPGLVRPGPSQLIGTKQTTKRRTQRVPRCGTVGPDASAHV